MVKIHIVAVGKDKDSWITEGIAHFEKLLSRYAKIKWTIITGGNAKSKSPTEVKLQEAKEIKRQMSGGTNIALADFGSKCDSPALAKKIEKLLSQSTGEIRFIIGGPYGLDKSIIEKSNEAISLSSLTFSHQIVRLVLLEQLYRAFSILKGADYHK